MHSMKHHVCTALVLAAALAFAGCSKDPEVTKREHLARGDAYTKEKKHREAVIEYRNAIQADPNYGEARFRLAKAYIELQDWPAAYRESVRAADLLPNSLEAQLTAAELLVLAQKFEDARGRADRALAIDPKNVQAQLLKGNISAGLKDLDTAIAEVESAVSMDPGRGLSYTSLGQLQWAKGDRKAAQEAFLKAMELEPKDAKPDWRTPIFCGRPGIRLPRRTPYEKC